MENIINPYIIALLIVSISLIYILKVIFKNKDKWQKPDLCKACKEGIIPERRRMLLHLGYVISGLTIIIVLLFIYIAVQEDPIRTPSPTMYEYFSFGSVIVSIVLAVLTIVYSYYTNNRSTGQAEKITNTADDIQEASSEILKSADQITNNADSLSEHISQIISKLDAVGTSAREAKEESCKLNVLLTQSLEEKRSSSDNVSESIEVIESQAVQMDNTTTKNISNDSILKLIDKTSVYSKQLLLACVYSNKTKKSFTIEQILNDNKEYAWGYLVCLSSLQLIDFDLNNDVFNIAFIHNIIINNIESILIENIDNSDDVNNNINKIKEYFNI